MAGIVTGLGLGLQNSSLTQLGAKGLLGQAQFGQTNEHVYVNAATGNLVLQQQDEFLSSTNLNIHLNRTYNSQGLADDDNGDNWRLGYSRSVHSLSGKIHEIGSSIIRTAEDGSQLTYYFDKAAHAYIAKAAQGGLHTLSYQATLSQWVWHDAASGIEEYFDADGRLSQIIDRDYNNIILQYNDNGLITAITNSNGDALYIDYDTAVERQSNIVQLRTESQAQTTQRVRYQYDTLNRLTQVIIDLSPDDGDISDGNTYLTHYHYADASRRLSRIEQSDGSCLAFEYVKVEDTWRVSAVQDIRSSTDSRMTRFSYAEQYTVVTDATGQQTQLAYDDKGQLLQLYGPQVNGQSQVLSYSYDHAGNVTHITDARDAVMRYRYDAQGNRIFERDALGNTIERTYNTDNKLLSVTTYTVADPDDEGPQKPQGAQTTFHVYDAHGHPRFVISPQGRVTEQRYDGAGRAISQIQYSGAQINLTQLSHPPTLSEVATWVSQQDLQQSQRVDTQYDLRGLVSQITRYSQVDAMGQGSASHTHYIYDAHHNLLQTIDSRGAQTDYVYDGLNRLLRQKDALGNTTTTVYLDHKNQTQLTLSNGLTTIKQYDRGGNLLSTLLQEGGAVLGSTHYQYDSNDRLRAITDPLGQRSYIVYDALGQKTGSIDASGALTEYTYNLAGQLTQTIFYANRVDTALLKDPLLLDLNQLRPSVDNLNDRHQYTVYDLAGQIVQRIDADGAVSVYRYDGAGQLQETIQYAERLTDIQLTALASAGPDILPTDVQITAHANDRHSRQFYDADGLLLATLDEEGYLTEQRYDAAGRLIESIRYATVCDDALRTVPTAVPRPPATEQDQHTHYFYDAHHQQIAMVDAAGYLTAYQYDSAGNKTHEIRYATPAKTLADVHPHPEDAAMYYEYDALGRVIRSEQQPAGLVTIFTYDSQGNLLCSERTGGAADVRRQRARYDSQGRLIAELNGTGVAALANAENETAINAVWAQWGTTHRYDAAGQRIATVLPDGQGGAGRQSLNYYDSMGRLSHTLNPLGEVTEYHYDAFGQKVWSRHYAQRVSPPQLATLQGGKSHELTPLLTTLRSDQDSVQYTTYDQRGQISVQKDALGQAVRYAYDAFGLLTQKWEPLTRTTALQTDYQYDRRGLQLSQTQDKDGLNLSTGQTYDAFGRLLSQKDARGNISHYQYDQLGRQISHKNANGESTQTTYDAFGRKLTSIDALGYTTSWQHNGNTLTQITAEGIKTISESNAFGERIRVIDGNGHSTTYEYNPAGQLLKTRGPAGGSLSRYDPAGQEIETIDARGTVTRFSYDAAGRMLTRIIDPDGLKLTTRYSYDALGRTSRVIDAQGSITDTQYDANGQVLSVMADVGGLNINTLYHYDEGGRKVEVTSAAGSKAAQTTHYHYDSLGRRIKETVDPQGLALTTQYQYDQNNNVITRTDAQDQLTYYTYDAAGQLIYTLDAAGAVNQNSYDMNGRIVRTIRYANALNLAGLPALFTSADIAARLTPSAADQSQSSIFDTDGRLIQRIDALGYVTGFDYDANGNQTHSVRYATALTGTWTEGERIPVTHESDQHEYQYYDAANRLSHSIDAAGYVTQYEYDAIGHVLHTIRYATASPGPFAQNSPPVTAHKADRHTYAAYDAVGRQVISVDSLGYARQSWHDAAGNVIRTVHYATALNTDQIAALAQPYPFTQTLLPMGETDITTHSHYDAANRLIESKDALGMVTRQEYDAAGQLTRSIRAFGTDLAVSTRYQYDAAGRLLQQTEAADSQNARTTFYQYDAAGNRISLTDARGLEACTVDNAWTLELRQALNILDAQGHPKLAKDLTDADRTRLQRHFTTTYTYNSLGKQISQTDALGNRTDTEYDAFGNAVRVIDPRGYSGYFYFDARNQAILSIDPAGSAVRSHYDAFGKVKQITRYSNPVTGPIVSETEPTIAVSALLDQITYFKHDKRNLQTKITDAEGYSELLSYDAFGNKISYTNKLKGVYHYQYDLAGRVTQETLPVQAKNGAGILIAVVKRYAYDVRGNLIRLTEAAGLPEERVTLSSYDLLDRLTQTSLLNQSAQDGAITAKVQETRQYDALGQVIKTEDANGGITKNWYNNLGKKIAERNSVGTLSQWDYDVVGNAIAQRIYADPVALDSSTPINASNVRLTRYRFDAANRLLATTTPDQIIGSRNPLTGNYEVSKADLTVRYHYDAVGNLIQQIDARGSSTYRYYDKVGRKTLEIDNTGYATTWQYDAAGNILKEQRYANKPSLTVQASTPVDDIYVSLKADPTHDRVSQFSYDHLNRVIIEKRLNILASRVNGGNGVVTEQMTDAITHYQYNGLGKVTEQSDALNGNTSYRYDLISREIQRQGVEYSDYRGIVVRPTTDSEYNGLDQLTRTLVRGDKEATEADDQITRFEYGIGGLLLNQYDPTGARTAYQYDNAGQISRSTVYEYNGEQISTDYRYDTAGREIERRDVNSGMRYETQYNAYGEYTGKRTGTTGTGSWQEYAVYDNAGRMVKSNSGGAGKAYFYDANGNPTLQIEAPEVDLRALTLDQIVQRNGDVFRTVTQYDQANRVTDVYQPTMQQARDLVVVKQWITVTATDSSGGVVEVGPNQAENTTPASHPLAHGAATLHGRGNIHYAAEAHAWFRVNSAPNPNLGADRHMWTDHGGVTYILPDNYSGLGDGPFYVEVLMKSMRPRPGSPYLHVTYQVPYGAYSNNIALRADGRYAVSFHVPLDGLTDGHNINYQTILYKQTPYGNVVVSPLSEEQYTVHTHDDYTATMSNGGRWATGLGAIKYSRIFFTGQPLNTQTLLMYYRTNDNGWTRMIVPTTVINGHVVPGSFDFDWTDLTVFPYGTHEFLYWALDGNGNILNFQYGHFGTHATGGGMWQKPQAVWPAGGALIDQHGHLFVYNLGSNAKQASLRYRLPGGNWNVMQGNMVVGGVIFPVAGRLINGQRYELCINIMNSAGHVIKRSVSQFILGNTNSIKDLKAYQDQPQIVHFKNQHLSATHGVVRHRKINGSIWAETRLTKNGAGQFYWDATGMVEHGSSANYEYEYLLYDKQENLINHAQGQVRLGDENKLLSHRGISTPVVVSFNPNNVKHTLPNKVDLTAANGRLKINGANSLVKKGVIRYRDRLTDEWTSLNLLSAKAGEWDGAISTIATAKTDQDNSISYPAEPDSSPQSDTAFGNTSKYDLTYQLLDASGNVLHQGSARAEFGEQDKILSHNTESFFATKTELTIDQATSSLQIQGVDISATSGILHYRQKNTDTWLEVNATKDKDLQSWRYDLKGKMHKISLPGKWPSPFESASRLTIDKQFNNLLDIKTQQKCLELLSSQYWQDPKANDFYEYEFDISDKYARKIKVREKGGHTWWGQIVINLIEMPTENWLHFSAIEAPTVKTEKGTAGESSQYYIEYRAGSPDFELTYQFLDSAGKALNTGTGQVCLGVGRDKIISHHTHALPPAVTEKNAATLLLYYRRMDSDTLYESLIIPRAENGLFNFDASHLMPERNSATYEYYYALSDKAGNNINDSLGKPIRVEGVLHFRRSNQINPDQNSEVRYVINGIANESITIHRAQQRNAFGEVIQEIDGLGRVTDFRYNTLGKLLQKQDPETTITLENGAQVRQRPTTRYYYDLLGNTIATQDANGHINSQILLAGSQGEQIRVTQEFHADGGQKSSAYDKFSNLRLHTDEVSRQTQYAYDQNNRLIRINRPNGGFDSYEYNARGQRVAHSTTADGRVILRDSSAFDSLGRITQTVSAAGRTLHYSYQWEASIIGAGGLVVGGWRTTKRDANHHTLIDDNEVFGQIVRHVDLGGHVFNYTYNHGGKLKAQTGSTGQNIRYTYYHNGYIKDINDLAQDSYTFYEYDREGNRTFEGYTSLDAHNTRTYHQYSEVSYDELNRIKVMLDPKFQVRYEYDAVGNRRRVQSYYHDGINGQERVQDYWYRYDSMNRFVVTMGSFNGERGSGNITAGGINSEGVEITYNAASERVSARYARDGHRETYTYDQGGYLKDLHIDGQFRVSRHNDLMGRTVSYTEYNSGEWDTVTTHTSYDSDSLSMRQSMYSLKSGKHQSSTTDFYRLADGTIDRTFQQSHSSEGKNPTTIDTYYGYEWWDEAKQSTLTSHPYNKDAPGWKPGISHHTYNVNGHLKNAIDETGNRTFRYVTNAQGLILKREELDKSVYRHHNYYYLDSKRIGDVGNDGDPRIDYAQSLAQKAEARREDSYRNWRPISSADFDQNYEPIGPNYPSQAPGSYTARSGDTLQSVARSVWGDSSLWYLLADANGLSGSEVLVNGQVLTIPNKVTNIHNNSNTMRVYNPGEAIGDTSPTLPKPPPPAAKGKKGCGGAATIFVAIVAIVVTVYTAGAAASAMGAMTTTATTTAAGTTLAAGTAAASMGTMAAGVAALSGGLGMAGFAAAMIGGAVGAIAAQGVAIATGLQDKFSWNQVAMAGIGAGVTTIAMGMGSLNTLSGTLVRATASNMVTQGISVAVGMQDKFSWTAVAAAGIGAAVGYGVGKAGNYLTNHTFTDSFTGKLAMGMGNASVRASMQQGSNINWGEVAASSFGHALGDQMVNAISQQDAQGIVKANSAAKLDMLSAAGATLYGAVLSPADIEGIFSYRPADSALSAPQGPATLRAANVGGSAERAARAQLGAQASQHDINTYTAQLIELNNISPRHVSKDAVWRLPDSQTPAPTHGLAVYGQDIALGEQQKAMAAQRAAAQQWSVRESLYGTNSLACTSTDGMGVAHRLAAMVQKGSVTLLPSIETGRNTVKDWYKPQHGFFEKLYARSVSGMVESESWLGKAGHYALATTAFIPAMAEGVVTGLYNAPNHFYRAGNQFAQAYEKGNWAIAGSGAVDFVHGTLGALPLTALGSMTRPVAVSTGNIISKGPTGAFIEGTKGGVAFGKLANRNVNVTEKGIHIVENHLQKFGEIPENNMMSNRLRIALAEGQPIKGADAIFYTHELAEATKMKMGMPYKAAHEFSLNKYQVSPYSVYHPEVIESVNQQLPGSFNNNWLNFWGIK
jgi:YD repeat-containing protein